MCSSTTGQTGERSSEWGGWVCGEGGRRGRELPSARGAGEGPRGGRTQQLELREESGTRGRHGGPSALEQAGHVHTGP